MILLETKGLARHFGGLMAVHNLDLGVSRGEILGLIGPNGAGKSTLFNLICGFHPPTKGEIIYKGEPIGGLKTHKIAEKGIVKTFQSTIVSRNMSVAQNVILAHNLLAKSGLWTGIFNPPSVRKVEKAIVENSMEILEFMGLASFKDEQAKNLPHGQLRMLGVSIALAAKPELLLLDEPMSGMNLEEMMTMAERIGKIRERGITIMLIEHHMRAVMEISDRIIVLNFGSKIAEGTPQEVKENKTVVEAYLGVETDVA